MKPISELSRTTHIVKAEPLMSFQYRRVKKEIRPFTLLRFTYQDIIKIILSLSGLNVR